MMVIYLPVKFEFVWTQRFGVMLTDKRTHGITPISKET